MVLIPSKQTTFNQDLKGTTIAMLTCTSEGGLKIMKSYKNLDLCKKYACEHFNECFITFDPESGSLGHKDLDCFGYTILK